MQKNRRDEDGFQSQKIQPKQHQNQKSYETLSFSARKQQEYNRQCLYTETMANKISMLEANINRVYNQNQRLLPLLSHQNYFHQLMDHIRATEENKVRLNELKGKLKEFHQKIKNSKIQIAANMCDIFEKTNKNLLLDIQEIKDTVKSAMNAIDQNKIKFSSTISKSVASMRLQIARDFESNRQKYMEIIKKPRQNLTDFYSQTIVKNAAKEVSKQLQRQVQMAKIQIGCLQNQIQYFLSLESNKRNKSKNVEQFSQNRDIFTQNCQRLLYELSILNFKSLKLNSNVECIQNLIKPTKITKYTIAGKKVKSTTNQLLNKSHNQQKSKQIFETTKSEVSFIIDRLGMLKCDLQSLYKLKDDILVKKKCLKTDKNQQKDELGENSQFSSKKWCHEISHCLDDVKVKMAKIDNNIIQVKQNLTKLAI